MLFSFNFHYGGLSDLCYVWESALCIAANPGAFNLSAGALVTGLAPTATALAGYFCISDVILITQCLYYNTLNARKARLRARSTETAVSEGGGDSGEEEPLLRRRRTSSSAGLPGSHRRHSVRHEDSGFDSLKRVVTGEDDTPDRNPWLHNSLGLVAVWVVGAAGWFFSYRVGAWDRPEIPEEPSADEPVAVVGIVLGYASAVCYLWSVYPVLPDPFPRRSPPLYRSANGRV